MRRMAPPVSSHGEDRRIARRSLTPRRSTAHEQARGAAHGPDSRSPAVAQFPSPPRECTSPYLRPQEARAGARRACVPVGESIAGSLLPPSHYRPCCRGMAAASVCPETPAKSTRARLLPTKRAGAASATSHRAARPDVEAVADAARDTTVTPSEQVTPGWKTTSSRRCRQR